MMIHKTRKRLVSERPVSLPNKVFYVAIPFKKNKLLGKALKGSSLEPITLYCLDSKEVLELPMKQYDLYKVTGLSTMKAVSLDSVNYKDWKASFVEDKKIGYAGDIKMSRMSFVASINTTK